MFEHTSRYYSLETAIFIMSDGRDVRYARRRFLPLVEGQLLAEVTVTEGDRLDLITFRTLGDPLHFWRICDSNNAMNPVDLTTEVGRTLRITIPQA
jgi:hypothetical protein